MRSRTPQAAPLVLALLGFAAVIALVRVGAEWLAATDGITDAAKRAEEIGRARTTVLAVLAGGLAAVGAYYTHRSFGLNQQGQITERFTRAIDQLGNESVDVKLGGIYALERLARESREDHGPIVEILTAFVREHSPAPAEHVEQDLIEREPESFPGPPTTDVQAALTVLGRRTVAHDPPRPWRLDLHGAYLPRAQMAGASLVAANLADASLLRADLRSADLSDAALAGARMQGALAVEVNLQRADLRSAALSAARLVGANMQGARLFEANLRKAVLHRAQLQRCELTAAKLNDADLRGADLTGATLEATDVSGARYDRETLWPAGFDAEAAGARLIGRPTRGRRRPGN